MERSKMIEIIETVLHQDGVNYYSNTAMDILNAIEEEGMLPPIDNHLFYMDGDHADVNNTVYRKWKPEE